MGFFFISLRIGGRSLRVASSGQVTLIFFLGESFQISLKQPFIKPIGHLSPDISIRWSAHDR
jgi:hypothetical protein